VRRAHVVRSPGRADELLLGVGRVEPDQLVDELSIAHRAGQRAEHRRIPERLRVLLSERGERDFLRQLGRGDRDVLLFRERIEHEQRFRPALRGVAPIGPDLLLGLARLQEELLPGESLILHPRLQIRHEVVDLIGDEDLRHLDGGAVEQMGQQLLSRGVAAFVE